MKRCTQRRYEVQRRNYSTGWWETIEVHTPPYLFETAQKRFLFFRWSVDRVRDYSVEIEARKDAIASARRYWNLENKSGEPIETRVVVVRTDYISADNCFYEIDAIIWQNGRFV